MFEKLLSKTAASAPAPEAARQPVPATSSNPDVRGDTPQKTVTVIAAETVFTGHLVARGDVHVRGRVQGNILVEEGCVKLMRSGRVEGDIQAPHILLDGEVTGRCIADAVDILEHGCLDGIVQSARFSIRTGGHFIGQAESPADAPEGLPPEVTHEVAHEVTAGEPGDALHSGLDASTEAVLPSGSSAPASGASAY